VGESWNPVRSRKAEGWESLQLSSHDPINENAAFAMDLPQEVREDFNQELICLAICALKAPQESHMRHALRHNKIIIRIIAEYIMGLSSFQRRFLHYTVQIKISGFILFF